MQKTIETIDFKQFYSASESEHSVTNSTRDFFGLEVLADELDETFLVDLLLTTVLAVSTAIFILKSFPSRLPICNQYSS